MSGGAFLTSREIFTNPIWQNIVEFRLFFLIYGNATFVDGVRIGDTELKRGQWLRSIRNIQKDLEYIENRAVKIYALSTLKRAIDNLVKQKRIAVEVSELGTLFTVLNYQQYQGFDGYKSDNLERRENAEETATKRRRNNNKNDINANNAMNDLKDKENTFSAYTENTDLQDALNSFVEFRKKIKKPMTDKAVPLLLKQLDKLGKNDGEKIAILEQSILQGWQGLYELKDKGAMKHGQGEQQRVQVNGRGIEEAHAKLNLPF